MFTEIVNEICSFSYVQHFFQTGCKVAAIPLVHNNGKIIPIMQIKFWLLFLWKNILEAVYNFLFPYLQYYFISVTSERNPFAPDTDRN